MNTYAIVETGGKQLRVEPQQLIAVERVNAPTDKKKEIVLDRVLLVQKGESIQVGNPYLKNTSVVCEYLQESKGEKKITFKMKRRKNYRRKIGHRQLLTELRVKEIQTRE